MSDKLAVADGSCGRLPCLDQPYLVPEAFSISWHLRSDVHEHCLHLSPSGDHCLSVCGCLQLSLLHDLVQASPGECVHVCVCVYVCVCVCVCVCV